MAGMIEPRRLIITTLSFLLGCKGDLDHSPAQRGRHSNGARKGQMVRRSGGAGTPTHRPVLLKRHCLVAVTSAFEGKAEVTRAAPNRRD
jgi:hypothetical protein